MPSFELMEFMELKTKNTNKNSSYLILVKNKNNINSKKAFTMSSCIHFHIKQQPNSFVSNCATA